MKYNIKEFRERFAGRGHFTVQDAKKFLKEKGAGEGYSKLLLHNLARRGEIFRITKGAYTFTKGTSALSSVFSPSYHGLQEALTIHRIWGQGTNQVIITPRKVRSGEREIIGRKVIVRRIGRKMFFGHEIVNYGGEWLSVSDPEKTLLDFLYFREPLDRETQKKLLKMTDAKTLRKYLKLAPKTTRQMALKAFRNLGLVRK
ncbi:MAG: hypothetical protein HY544_02570 [Candidatus Diapherotrites archaeon]|uniref:Transcriptional regulator n=1 Tax=Candidatus Iainarchaeum sp. TaxID=3101447 RepID=A0A8T3YMV8_9ARCH|nr:hypothetical protein [Candidatus Diapherotrites archaeon]